MDHRLLKLTFLVFMLIVSLGLQAQIPDSRVMDWSNAGVVGGIPTGGEEIRATDYGIVADGKTDNTAAINSLVNSDASLNKVIKFPAGTIRCEGKIDFPVSGHRVIRGTLSGTGEKLTKFIFNTGTIGGNTGNFNVKSGSHVGKEIVVNSGYTKGSNQLTLASTEGLSAGDYIELRQDNDMSIMDSYHDINIDDIWYKRNIGQLFKVTAVNTSSKVITLSQSLRFNYKAGFNPAIQEIKATEKVGFEDFYTESLQTGNKCNFYFGMAANCWIKNVHSYKTVTAHVNILQSLNLTIRESLFDHSHEHGGGGQGYGVVAASRTVDCLIENNEFTRLRHSMMTKQASNGNVFGYNYSHDNINIYNSSNPTVDISIHGHYSYMNLFEGNSVEWIQSADWWGPSGPGTTFFRNKVVWWDIFLDDNSQDQNVVGNELTNTTKRIRIHESVKNPFVHGNIEGNVVNWDPNSGTDNVKESYYLKQKPSFLKSDDPWPLYGPKPLTGDEGLISWEIWKNVGGDALANVPFDQDPSEQKYIMNFEGPVNMGDNYGARISGILVPPATGKYVFFLAADDKGELWLSTDENPSKKKKIADVTAYTSSRQWDKYTSQQSAEISLEAGKKYYIEAIQKEGSGGDNLAVGWKLSNGTYERPIPAIRFASGVEEEIPNKAPVIILKEKETITLPTNSITLSGTATDADGTIASYTWTKVGGPAATMEGASTASLQLKALLQGTYTFKLTVKDNDGATASKDIVVEVLSAPNKLPLVGITSPSNNASYELETELQFLAEATDADGTIAKVEFYAGNTKLGEDTTAPFAYNWSPSTAGNYIISAKATDNDGGTNTSATIVITVEEPEETEEPEVPENTPPVINLKEKETITLPTNSITLSGTATDADGTIASYTWTKVIGPAATMEGASTASLQLKDLVEGTYTFQLTAKDNDGATASKEILLQVFKAPNQVPEVGIKTPSINATFELGAELIIQAEANDTDGTIAKVEFYVGGAKIGEDNTAPYTYSWSLEKAGKYILTVKATDDKGANSSPEAVSITVIEKEEETTVNAPPVVSLKEEETLTLPSNTITLAGSASDTDGEVVEYTWTKVSGPSAGMSGNSTTSLKISQLEEGIYVFRLTVKDNKGASAYKEIKVIVFPLPNQLPTVEIISPVVNDSFVVGEDVNIMVDASDADGTLSKVEFFHGENKLGEATTAPFTFTWNPAKTGAYTIVARATDNKGAIAFSNIVFVKIEEAPKPENIPPGVSIIQKETFTLPLNSITLTASASDADGLVEKYLWTQLSGPALSMEGSTTASLKLSKLVEGSFVYKITVTDNDGASASREVTVVVLPQPNILPLVRISSPAVNTTYELGDVIEINAAASDEDGTITKVVFYAGFVKVGEVTTSPYEINWTPSAAGTYSVTAKAFDNAGASGVSEVVRITVKEREEEPVIPTVPEEPTNPEEPNIPEEPTVPEDPTNPEEPTIPEEPKEPVVEFLGEGTIFREFWGNASGSYTTDIPVEETPTETTTLSSFEGPVNAAQNYGSRIRGYVHPPVSGEYTFWISGDDVAELYLSTDENPDNVVLVAQASNNKIMRQWNKNAAQQSVAISLEGGKKYYIEALHKETNGGDHVSVGWQLADGTYERPIPGKRLSPFVLQDVKVVNPEVNLMGTINLYPNPAEDKLFVEIDGATAGDGVWTIMDVHASNHNQHSGKIKLGGKNPIRIDLRKLNLPNGMYILKIESGSGYQVVKFMKQ